MITAIKFSKRNNKYFYIKNYLETNGWTIIQFNTQSDNKILQTLNIEYKSKTKDGFIYKSKNVKYIFINSSLNDEEKTLVLLHELGHIVLKHDFDNCTKENEAQAWCFAYDVYTEKTKTQLKKVLFFGCVLILSLILIFAKINDNCKMVYVTKSGTKYHLQNCYCISSKNYFSLTKSEAKKNYTKCSICKP